VRISAGKTGWNESESSHYFVKELRASAFCRVIQLPEALRNYNADPEAVIKDGVLTLKWRLPEGITKPTVRKIEVKKE
jgi:HSP20 family molecular chaperone IbpA